MTFVQAVKELELHHPITGKPVTARELIDILKEDVVYVVTRPGSWEGAHMQTVLQAHGFFYPEENRTTPREERGTPRVLRGSIKKG